MRSKHRLQSEAPGALEQKAQPERNARVLCRVTRALLYLQARAVRKRPKHRGPWAVGEEVRGRPVLCAVAQSTMTEFVGHGVIVRLFDFDARMCALARLFFPDENVVRQFDIRVQSVGALVADVEC